jgi:sugar lactone lactonase YvrE
VGPEDQVYIPDSLNHVIRRVDHDGMITTIAGVGRPGFAGDGGPATSALMDAPQAIVFDDRGNLIFDDEHNHAIRIISRDGRISTLIGTGTAGYAADGMMAAEAPLNDPEGILVRRDGTLLISDGGNGRVLEITEDGKIRNFAGRC